MLQTPPCAIAAKRDYGTILANVDWLHGTAESLLTITNLLIGAVQTPWHASVRASNLLVNGILLNSVLILSSCRMLNQLFLDNCFVHCVRMAAGTNPAVSDVFQLSMFPWILSIHCQQHGGIICSWMPQNLHLTQPERHL